jgi:uncharacterized protein
MTRLPILSNTGATPSREVQARAIGRLQVLRRDEAAYLYVPERVRLYKLDPRLADALEQLPGLFAPDVYRSIVDSLPESQVDGTMHALTSEGGERRLKDLVINVSQVCNLDCGYCYAEDLNKVSKVMNEDTASHVLRTAFALAGENGLRSLKFLGGEPLVALPTIAYVLRQVRELCARRAMPEPNFVVVTNGTLVDDAFVELAAEFDMHVIVSIDGPADLHDRLRPTRGGKPSHANAGASVARLLAKGVRVALEGVFSRAHLEHGVTVRDMISHYMALGIRDFQIAPTVGSWHQLDVIDQIETVADQFAAASADAVRSLSTHDPYVLRGTRFAIQGFVQRKLRPYVCGAGRQFMAVNYDGSAYPCYLLESDELRYGNVADPATTERFVAGRERHEHNGKDYHEDCSRCWANEICQSCLGTTFMLKPQLAKPPRWFCLFQKRIISAVLSEIALASERVETFATFRYNVEGLVSDERFFTTGRAAHVPS